MTLIELVKSGQIPERVRKVAEKEQVEMEKLAPEISLGTVVIPQNLLRSSPNSQERESGESMGIVGIGRGLRAKVNANIGTSEDYLEIREELNKLEVALKAGADTIMDLSTGGDIPEIRRKILANCQVPLGTVPIYEAAVRSQEEYGSIVEMTEEDIFQTIEAQAQEGVDFMTVHCGICWNSLEALEKEGRIMDVVSRGGAFTIGWMIHHQKENPLYENFDRLLEIAYTYDITLSLGDGMRPGCLADASDRAQISELLILGELVERAREANVQVIVEGPGHLPLDHIEANIRLEKEVCSHAPFYVLGPLVTDIAPGYDHITSAVGGALAAVYGADFLCYVTPKEHLGLPTAKDVKEGVIAARIAAHAADIVKKVPGASSWDREMARARKTLDWQKQEKLSLDPEKTRQFYQERKSKEEGVCTMCSGYCAVKLVGEYLQVEYKPKCL